MREAIRDGLPCYAMKAHAQMMILGKHDPDVLCRQVCSSVLQLDRG